MRHSPETLNEFKKLFKSVGLNADPDNLESFEEIQLITDDAEDQDPDNGSTSNTGSMKENSPFTSFFKNISNEAQNLLVFFNLKI